MVNHSLSDDTSFRAEPDTRVLEESRLVDQLGHAADGGIATLFKVALKVVPLLASRLPLRIGQQRVRTPRVHDIATSSGNPASDLR